MAHTTTPQRSRQSAIEEAAASTLQSPLLTPHIANVFVDEFNREVSQSTDLRQTTDDREGQRLEQLNEEIETIAQNMPRGVVSSTVAKMLAEREGERDLLEREVSRQTKHEASILPHPVLMQRFEQKVRNLREALNGADLRTEASQVVRSLIEVITIHVEADQTAADVEASLSTLVEFATKDDSPGAFAQGAGV